LTVTRANPCPRRSTELKHTSEDMQVLCGHVYTNGVSERIQL